MRLTCSLRRPDRPRASRSRVLLRGAVAVLTVALVLVPGVAPAAPSTRIDRDVVVYGGTPAGVAAAVAAADAGAKVTLLAEGSTVGGMMSNGISASDIGSPGAVTGIAKEFFAQVRKHYGDPTTWRFEPRVAERIFRDMLTRHGVQVRTKAPLTRVVVKNRKITCLVVPTARSYCAENFVDASYTGDALAMAGVPARLGLADLLDHQESLPLARDWEKVVAAPADRADATAAYLQNPFIRIEPGTLPPYRDVYAQGGPSLAYRLCVTPDAARAVPFRPAANYAQLLPSFKLLAGSMGPAIRTESNGTLNSDIFQLARIPGGKYDLNAGWKAFTNIPAPAGYFTSRASRTHHNTVLRNYIESFFYFVGNDPSVPAALRTEFSRFGLCADEFVDNGNWPREPYVREALRIHGRYTMTERDLFTTRTKSGAIALGSYNVDIKISQWVSVDGALFRDRSVHSTAPVYEIPYTAMVPRAGSVLNVLAPVAVSSSPTAYGSLRMEPQYMSMGQAAGIAAALGARTNRTTASLPAAWVQKELRAGGTLHKAVDVCRAIARNHRPGGGYTADCSQVLPVAPRPLY
ncbi:MAG: hypothetical protein AVDCRST_MAG66-4462 [uncultured Pseudonocardia sp.]|uniref:FAD dependent oxidoreductase n=1 Tax=uncultured Pseudonocardia sp. TaxID=211455 RepID=A0A6J4QU44_9PSEU|nr:MAG: hypothetical protein AVDCRST_MAG66-4462 [uncultured Pseudonocardia sp.]